MKDKFFAVIDTNVIVSALISKNIDSNPGKVFRAIVQERIVPLYNDEILAEYRCVLSRPKFHLSPDLIETVLKAIIVDGLNLDRVPATGIDFPDPKEQVRTERMSRHIYDISQMMDTPIAERALKNKTLYDSVVEHRRIFIGLKGFDYSTLQPKTISIVPPADVIELWRKDYKVMQETMIYGDSLPFDKLIEKIRMLNDSINSIEH